MPSEFPEQREAPVPDVPPVTPDARTPIADSAVRSLWTGKVVSWSLLVIAVGGWFLAWLVHRGMHMPFVIEDFGTRAFIVASAAFLLLLLVKIPQWQVADLSGTDRDRFSAENEARRTFAQVVGGIGLVAGLYFTSLQVRSTQDTAAKNEALTRDGQITDRYIKAVQQLGTTDPQNEPVRIGAIFALERIARESKLDHWPIMELLTAFVRQRSSASVAQKESIEIVKKWLAQNRNRARTSGYAIDPDSGVAGRHIVTGSMDRYSPNEVFVDELASFRLWRDVRPTDDVQAALTVIARRTVAYEERDTRRLNLRGANLRGVNLTRAHLESADLEGANLSGAVLDEACLSGADFSDTLEAGTSFIRADLRNAELTTGTVTGVQLRLADLRQANFFAATLKNVPAKMWMDGADLQGAKITPEQLGSPYLETAGAVPVDERGFATTNKSMSLPPKEWNRHCVPKINF
jgi:hypothetical protein